MSRKKRITTTTAPTNLTAFRCAERLWKDRSRLPDLSSAFDEANITWDSRTINGRTRGLWAAGPTGQEETCWRVPMADLSEAGIGQVRWKGKEREGEPGDYAIIIPRVPGLVFFPRILPDAVQRSLVVETLQHARRPNLTQLDRLYELPSEGLWNAWTAGKGDELVPQIVEPERPQASDGSARSQSSASIPRDMKIDACVEVGSKGDPISVRTLVPKLRWSNVGWHYNWSTKLYEFDRGHVPLPSLIQNCCRTLVRQMPWQHVFDGDDWPGHTGEGKSARDWESWRDVYEPDAGIINFYQIKDSLTSHVDQAEVDAVSPLVSFSLGHASIFLIGGLHRDVPPLAILLRSGDGLCMAGPGRRAYHGLPRVLEGSLPDYLRASQPEAVEGIQDWTPYGEYLERGARINVNVRSVFGCSRATA